MEKAVDQKSNKIFWFYNAKILDAEIKYRFKIQYLLNKASIYEIVLDETKDSRVIVKDNNGFPCNVMRRNQ
jgi:hypothetical protein